MSDRKDGQPLSGLRVLDLSRVLAGPWATQTLGDMGAEVIKIERPGVGDETRAWGPPWLSGGADNAKAESAYFLSANRNKKSVTVDFKRPEGQRLICALAARSDILIENYKAGGLTRYGLDYATLSEINPRLIYCSITGFGSSGPGADRPGYDFMIQGLSGLMSVTGNPQNTPGGDPQKIGVALVDILTGLYAANGILAALQQRHRTQRGQHIEISLFGTAVACLANQALAYLVSGEPPARMGNAHPSIVPYQAFATADGHLIVAVGNDAQFRRLCTAIGEQTWAAEERFHTNAARVANRESLVQPLREIFARRPTSEWLAILEAADVPCGPVNTIEQAFATPYAQDLVTHLPHTNGCAAPSVRTPLVFHGLETAHASAPPALGQHTDDILSGLLAMPTNEIEALGRSGVI